MTRVIRPASPKDIPLLVKARLDFLSALGYPVELYDPTKAAHQLEDFLTEHLGHDLFAWIAQEGETIAAAGFLQVIHVMWQPTAPEGKYGRIINILTWPGFRYQGLAREIMQALIQKARELNLSYIDLDASPEGQPLHESLGFNLLQAKHPPMRLYL